MPKLSSNPYVSLYESGQRWRITTCLIGGRRLTRRLGTNAAHAQRFAAKVSDWIQQWKSHLITERHLLQLIGESVAVDGVVHKYKAKLVEDGRGKKYIDTIMPRITILLKHSNVSQVKHLTQEAINRGLEHLKANGHNDRPLSDQTIRHYQRAARQFSRFLKTSKLVSADPLADIGSVSVREKVHSRRAPTKLETTLLIRHLWDLPIGKYQLDGRSRAMLYLLAMSTGYRAGELRAVRAEWVDQSTRILKVPAEHTKNSKDALQPLPAWLVDELRTWHPDPGVLWPAMPKNLAIPLRADQEAARAAWIGSAGEDAKLRAEREKSTVLLYRTDEGVFDFHSLRHFYITTVGRSGANVKDQQTLARHSDVNLTMGYSHSEAETLRDVIDNAFPDPR